MEYYLSVDGGGTKTEFLLESTDGTVRTRMLGGASSIKSVGQNAVREHLAQGLSALWEKAGAGPGQVRHAVFGLSGCDCAQDEIQLHGLLQDLGWRPGRYTLLNDAALAFYAAADPPGLVLIGGTGSIVMGVGSDGSLCRTGGWGYGFSDQGSGYWLGCRALEQALLYCDGCGPFAPWFADVARALGCSVEDLPQAATALEGHDAVAALAAVLLKDTGDDPLKEAILARGAAHLAALVRAGYQKLNLAPGESFHLVFAGGCLRNADYAARVERALDPALRAARVRGGENPPVLGGIRLARQADMRKEPME